jgi:hypothetical protein
MSLTVLDGLNEWARERHPLPCLDGQMGLVWEKWPLSLEDGQRLESFCSASGILPYPFYPSADVRKKLNQGAMAILTLEDGFCREL